MHFFSFNVHAAGTSQQISILFSSRVAALETPKVVYSPEILGKTESTKYKSFMS